MSYMMSTVNKRKNFSIRLLGKYLILYLTMQNKKVTINSFKARM